MRTRSLRCLTLSLGLAVAGVTAGAAPSALAASASLAVHASAEPGAEAAAIERETPVSSLSVTPASADVSDGKAVVTVTATVPAGQGVGTLHGYLSDERGAWFGFDMKKSSSSQNGQDTFTAQITPGRSTPAGTWAVNQLQASHTSGDLFKAIDPRTTLGYTPTAELTGGVPGRGGNKLTSASLGYQSEPGKIVGVITELSVPSHLGVTRIHAYLQSPGEPSKSVQLERAGTRDGSDVWRASTRLSDGDLGRTWTLTSVELRGAKDTPLGSFSPVAELGADVDIVV
ncbi:hypothetical protein EES43_24130 [Streptomyces sp. ADI96-02]|uniref:hypothetical protein n=1 Tax=Streptomyces sp. ADI96-02 TaxID=1522760 RepID=UPI000FC2E58B|nr:hypothetical protein [Streptomyces sp. ADI96-02]RPK56132.1 hypothetical protein EES43_24130 [Streptomyces sp. ADI96-02]